MGLLFTKAIGFNISAYLADNAVNFDGLNLTLQDDSQEVEVHWMLNKSAGDYVLIQPDPRAPLYDADSLEQDVP